MLVTTLVGAEGAVMTRYGRVWTLLCLLLFELCPSPAEAWELKIDSALLRMQYTYFSQLGSRGFFGPFNVDRGSTNGDLAAMNGWYRRAAVSGTTAENSLIRFVIFPSLKLNEAVTIYGTYRVGPYNTATAVASLDPDSESSISDDRWTRLWAKIDTPLGRITYGKRGFRQGCGLQFGSGRTAEELFESDRRSEEIFQLETFHGPLTISAGFYPWRKGSNLYWNEEDHNAARAFHLLAFVRYTAGAVDTGVGGFYFGFNEGPEGARSSAMRASTPPAATTATEGWIYLKYCDGMFFFNGEADWYYRDTRYQASRDGTFFGTSAETPGGGGSLFAPTFIESWRYMTELGLFSGPWKLSFLMSHIPGPDRRHGIRIHRQPFVQDPERSAYGVFYPYCLLMAKIYGAGVSAYRDMSAADVAAVRFDFMAASNLELFTSVMFARRNSQGYGWGYVRPDPDPDAFGAVNFGVRGTFADPSPAIPCDDLGWEVNVGLTWRLLENWELQLRGAYWRPGKWFNFACADKTIPNWDIPGPTNNFGTNPAGSIDPVLGIELFLDAKL